MSIWPDAFGGVTAVPAVAWGSPTKGEEAGTAVAADDLAATRAAMTAWACGDNVAGAGAAPPPAPAAAGPKALRIASACGFGGGGCAVLSMCVAGGAVPAVAWGSPTKGEEAGTAVAADDLAATRAAITAWACGDNVAGAGAAAPPAAVPAAAPDTPKALRMASACGFGGGGCVALAGFCAAKAAASAAVCGFCGAVVAAFCRVAKMAAACGFGAGGCGGVGPRSAGTLCQEAAPAGRGNPGADAVGVTSAGNGTEKLQRRRTAF